jgi:RHS repeat-associated protein
MRYAYAGGFAPVQFAVGSSSEQIYDVHSDHLDTPRMLTDEFDVPSWRASYEAFGAAHISTDPDGAVPTPDPQITFNIRFPGQYYDAESGLHYNRFRYYDPRVGRYVSADPIGQFDSANVYLYGANNPANLIDPYGLWPWGLPGRDAATQNAKNELDEHVPDLTDEERDKLAEDSIEEFGYGDIAKAASFGYGPTSTVPDDFSKLPEEQKDAIRAFLARVRAGNESAVGKCEAALSGKPDPPAPPPAPPSPAPDAPAP